MLFHRLCRTTQGILYEDTYLQIGLQSRYTRSNGELLLFLGNKHASSTLTGLALLLSGPSPAVQVVVGQLPPQLAPKQQVQVCGWPSRELRHLAGLWGSMLRTDSVCRILA
jgi:AP-2 complex subunit alpha